MSTFTATIETIYNRLNQLSETTNREAYTRLLAGKSATAPLQFIKKEFKAQAAEADYALVLNGLAESEYAQMEKLSLLPESEVVEADEAAADFMAEALGHLTSAADEVTTAEVLPNDAPSGSGSVLVLQERPALVVDARPALVLSSEARPTPDILRAIPTSAELAAILQAPVPSQTRTYTPLAHKDLIELVKEVLDQRGLRIKDERYNHNRMGQQMFGHMTVEGWNVEQDMSLGFRNSYDKSMQSGIVAGGRVVVCSNLMFTGAFKATAMHYGNVAAQIRKEVENAINNLEGNYKQLQLDTDKLQSVQVNERLIHEILGELFFTESIVTETQLKVIRQELKEQVRFGAETMWDIYNHTTEALKSTPAGQMVDRHVAAHEFYLAKA